MKRDVVIMFEKVFWNNYAFTIFAGCYIRLPAAGEFSFSQNKLQIDFNIFHRLGKQIIKKR